MAVGAPFLFLPFFPRLKSSVPGPSGGAWWWRGWWCGRCFRLAGLLGGAPCCWVFRSVVVLVAGVVLSLSLGLVLGGRGLRWLGSGVCFLVSLLVQV